MPTTTAGNQAVQNEAVENEAETLEARANQRLRRKLGFFAHALVFVLVNLGLYALNALGGEPHGSSLPLGGWGLGLAIHGIVTFIGLQGEGLRRSLLQREIEHLRRLEG